MRAVQKSMTMILRGPGGPRSNGVSLSYSDGGVRSPSPSLMTPPSASDADTSPFEWGGKLSRPLRSAHQLAGQRAGRLAVAIGDGARHDRGAIAARLLQQALAAGRQVPFHHRRLDAELVEVDDGEVGLVAGCQLAAV